MDEKLETLIEKLSLLLNTPAKQPFETKPSTAPTNLNKNAATAANSSKKPERLPELPPRKMVIEPPQQPSITHPNHLLNPSRPGKQREHETAISIQTNSNCTRSNLSCAQDWAKKSCASIRTSYRNLGVERADPHTYAQKYNSTLMYPNQMPEIADEVKIIHGIPLAADLNSKYYMELEGDIHALAMIDLDKEGLSEYKPYLQKIQTPPLPAIDHNTNKQTAAAAAATANMVASTIKSNLATDHKTVKQFSVSTMSSASMSNNTSTSSISTSSSTPLNKSSSDSGSEKCSSENSSKQNLLKQKTHDISAALNCRLDGSKACLKLKPQIEVETLKLEKPVPIVKHSFNVNNTRNYETDPKQLIKNQSRNTVINVPSNLNAIQRNAIIKKEQQQQQQHQQQQVPVKQVHFKDPKRSPPVASIPAAFGSTEYNKSSNNSNINSNNNNYSNSNSNKSNNNNNNNYANSGPRNSVATIIEANSMHNYLLDKMTPLPTTPLPTPIRNMLNSISALNNKNYTVDTVPNTPAAFSTPLPVPVVSLPPLPLPMSKSPLNNLNNNNKNNNHITITATTANTTNTNINTNNTLIKAATQSKLGSPSMSNIKSSQDVKSPQNNQIKTKSPIKIGHTSLKQLLKIYLKKQFQNKEIPDKAALTNMILRELNIPSKNRSIVNEALRDNTNRQTVTTH